MTRITCYKWLLVFQQLHVLCSRINYWPTASLTQSQKRSFLIWVLSFIWTLLSEDDAHFGIRSSVARWWWDQQFGHRHRLSLIDAWRQDSTAWRLWQSLSTCVDRSESVPLRIRNSLDRPTGFTSKEASTGQLSYDSPAADNRFTIPYR